MAEMFRNSAFRELDLSSFDTSKLESVYNIFRGCSATIGYARTQADADRLTAYASGTSLVFTVKP